MHPGPPSATPCGPTVSAWCSTASHADLPDTPLLVCEYGIGTADDEQRTAYLARGLEIVRAAIDRGVDVRGLFHWTGIDNYEWLHGFDLQFGIIDRHRGGPVERHGPATREAFELH